jgi:heterodisulfide reductase subunit C
VIQFLQGGSKRFSKSTKLVKAEQNILQKVYETGNEQGVMIKESWRKVES